MSSAFNYRPPAPEAFIPLTLVLTNGIINAAVNPLRKKTTAQDEEKLILRAAPFGS